LSGTYFTEPPIAVHWPLKSGYFVSSCAVALAISMKSAAKNATKPIELQQRMVVLSLISAESARRIQFGRDIEVPDF
jgi:hypothetical protein